MRKLINWIVSKEVRELREKNHKLLLQDYRYNSKINDLYLEIHENKLNWKELKEAREQLGSAQSQIEFYEEEYLVSQRLIDSLRLYVESLEERLKDAYS